ncbi:MAG TPA: hypothetical protein DC060_20140 [Gemmatimonadetes bacterium]|nr:hypothetical protein [Gemmatimonadota bacterium]
MQRPERPRRAWRFSSVASSLVSKRAISLVDAAYELGINFIDTADVYSSGASETMVGKALPGRRHDVALATKVRGRMGTGSASSPMKIAASRPSKTISTAMPSSVFWVGEGAVPPGP